MERALADTQVRGALDATDFVIGMYFIHACMTAQLHTIPSVLPPGLYDQASGRADEATGSTSPVSSTSPTHPPSQANFGTSSSTSNYGASSSSSFSGYPSLSRSSSVESKRPRLQPPIQPQYTGSTSSALSRSVHSQSLLTPNHTNEWIITPEDRTTANRFYDGLDTQGIGYVRKNIAMPFMRKSHLSEDDLEQIWYVLSFFYFPL